MISYKKSTEKFKMPNNDEQIITEITADIKRQIVLSHPNLNKPFNLKCDASDSSVVTILTQANNIVGIFSKKFS